MLHCSLLLRRQLQQAATAITQLVFQHPQRTVRSFDDTANALTHFVSRILAGFFTVQLDVDYCPRRQTCSERIATPTVEQVASAMVWLASKDNALTTGALVPVYGKM